MIRKSGSRFSEKIMLKQQSKARLPVSADIARFRCKRAAWQGRPSGPDEPLLSISGSLLSARAARPTKNPGHQARVFF
jgi:hypothetical protein